MFGKSMRLASFSSLISLALAVTNDSPKNQESNLFYPSVLTISVLALSGLLLRQLFSSPPRAGFFTRKLELNTSPKITFFEGALFFRGFQWKEIAIICEHICALNLLNKKDNKILCTGSYRDNDPFVPSFFPKLKTGETFLCLSYFNTSVPAMTSTRSDYDFNFVI